MRSIDLTPLFRSTIGFDHLARAMDAALQMGDQGQTYPPYNIEKLADDSYRLSMAVAGFSPDQLEIVVHDNVLVVRANSKAEDKARTYLYRGIAERSFERKVQLADYIRVTGARLDNGMLHIDMVREVPEAVKPRRIDIATDAPTGNRAASATVGVDTKQAA